MMNFYDYVKNGEEILEQLKRSEKKIVLYGIGSIGNFIGKVMGELVSCYCISDNSEHTKEFNGLPVYGIGSLPYAPEEVKVVLTLDGRHWNVVGEILNKKKYLDIDYATIEYQNSILSYFYMKLFSKNNVDMDNVMIELNGVSIRNPLKMNEVDFKAVLIEMNDLVMGDIFSDVSMWSEGPYQYEHVFLEKGDVVLDCGANLGLFSCIAASKGCTTYAFEPTQRLYQDLKFCADYYDQKIIPCNYALSDTIGEAQLAMSSEWDVANTIVNDNSNTIVQEAGYDKFETVKTITIDEFVKNNNIQKVDFIKADIEGAERLMLAGATNTLAKLAPKLAICTYHFKDDPQVLEEIIKKANSKYIISHKWKKLYAYVKAE